MILLLHGSGSWPWTMFPLEWYLKLRGYNVLNLSYPVNTRNLEECVDFIVEVLQNVEFNELTVIGQSMGGLIGMLLREREINVINVITVGSPVKGSKFLNFINHYIPSRIHKPNHYELLDIFEGRKTIEVPEHEYTCITMGLLPFINFDCCVFMDESKFDDENHIHLWFQNHYTVFFDPRLLYHIKQLL